MFAWLLSLSRSVKMPVDLGLSGYLFARPPPFNVQRMAH